MTAEKELTIQKPLVLIYEALDGQIITRLWPREKDSYMGYGLCIYDLVRHVANAYKVHEDDVWEWVCKERGKPTTDIMRPS